MLTAVLATMALALGADMQHQMQWGLAVNGQPVGRRDLTVKYIKTDDGMRRILESFTDIDGALGPIRVRWRQRLTAHLADREPASFHSVIEENGTAREIQARWTPSKWLVTNSADLRAQTAEIALNKIDLSTADLIDPQSRLPLSYFDNARILSAESGEVLMGKVEELGTSQITLGGADFQVTGYAWNNPEGRSEFYYSGDGFLVKYTVQLLGVTLEALLAGPPPGGLDDFPVAIGTPAVEISDL